MDGWLATWLVSCGFRLGVCLCMVVFVCVWLTEMIGFETLIFMGMYGLYNLESIARYFRETIAM